MNTQPAAALELDDGEEELGLIPHAARALFDGLEPELRSLDLSGLELGGRRGTTETRHGLTIRSL